MKTWDDLENEARLVENITNEKEPEIVSLLKNSVGIFADGFYSATGPDTDEALAKMSLLSHSFGTLKCSADTTLRGFYVQSMYFLRIVYENWISYMYLNKNPDKAILWLCPSRKKKPPKHAKMLQEIDDNYTPQKGKMKDWYKILCGFAHSDSVNLLPQISTIEVPGETSIHFGATYKSDLFRASAYSICMWAGISMLNLGSWVPEDNQWNNQMAKQQEKIMKFVIQENKAFKAKKILAGLQSLSGGEEKHETPAT